VLCMHLLARAELTPSLFLDPVQYFPGRGEEGYKVPFTKVVYIEVRKRHLA